MKYFVCFPRFQFLLTPESYRAVRTGQLFILLCSGEKFITITT